MHLDSVRNLEYMGTFNHGKKIPLIIEDWNQQPGV
jgi:hypothetical protein